jgi:hypothetical protein
MMAQQLYGAEKVKSTVQSHFRCTFLLLFLTWIAVPISLFAQNKEHWQASRETVDQLSKGQKEFNYEEDKVPLYTLPELFTRKDGTRISSLSDWQNIRRPELLELFTTQVYGRVPETRYQKSIRVIKEDKNAMNGEATLKLVDITISANNKSLTIHLGLFIPNKVKKPVPAFLLICNRPTENIDFTRTKKSEFWPAEEVIARGYAVAAYYNADVDPDVDDQFKNGIHGLLDQNRDAESWGTIAAWAWGASRCLDYMVKDKGIAPDKIAVVGHSRGAKTALWAGATDQRFSMVVCNEAGCGGSSLSRRRYGETVERINKAFPHWFCLNYRNFNNNENSLPVDQHMLMALIAPRPLYVASADKDLWGDPKGQYLALFNAVPAYNLTGVKSDLPDEMPPMNTPFFSGHVAYHVREGVHNMLLKDWNFFMDFADIVMKKNGSK